LITEVKVRGYDLNVVVYGPGINHKQPTLELYIEEAGLTLVIADPYEQLLVALDKMREMVVERMNL
jgi:hypothetical protein